MIYQNTVRIYRGYIILYCTDDRGPEYIFRCLFISFFFFLFWRVWYTLCASASSRQLKFRPGARAAHVRLSATAKVQPYHVRTIYAYICSSKCRLNNYFSIKHIIYTPYRIYCYIDYLNTIYQKKKMNFFEKTFAMNFRYNNICIIICIPTYWTFVLGVSIGQVRYSARFIYLQQ